MQSMISLFRFGASFAVLQTCVRGELGKFASGHRPSIEASLHVLWQWRQLRPDSRTYVCICPKSFLTCRMRCGTISNCSWPPRCCNICSCCGLESVRGQVHMYSFWMKRRLPNSSGSTARLDSKSCACGDDVVVKRSCPVVRRFRVGSLWFVFR